MLRGAAWLSAHPIDGFFPEFLLDTPPQDPLTTGFQVPACVQIRVSVVAGLLPFFPRLCIFIVPFWYLLQLCLILPGISHRQSLALGGFSVI